MYNILNFLQTNITQLIEWDQGCVHYKLDTDYGIFLGWEDGLDKNATSVIHSKSTPTWCLVVGIKLISNEYILTDYDNFDFPYLEDGKVLATEASIHPQEDFNQLIEHHIDDGYVNQTSYGLLEKL